MYAYFKCHTQSFSGKFLIINYVCKTNFEKEINVHQNMLIKNLQNIGYINVGYNGIWLDIWLTTFSVIVVVNIL